MKALYLFSILLIAASHPKQDCREKAIEETLLTTLIVGMEMREQHKSPSWQQIQDAVRIRLHKKARNK